MRPYDEWIIRAKSALDISKFKVTENVFYADLCAQAQQAVEKALKGLLIFYDVEPEYTHNIRRLVLEIRKHTEVDEYIEKTFDLTQYAHETRYPGDYPDVSEDEYKRVIEIANKCIEWVEIKIFEGSLEGNK